MTAPRMRRTETMADRLKLMAVLAHPDDESLGLGAALAKYASEGVEITLVTATRGEAGRYHGHRDDDQHPGPVALGRIREAELRAAAAKLGIAEVSLLDYHDQELDRANPGEAIASIANHIRRVRPHVVVTFPPDGAYGHPDHVAISQFATGAIVAAADATNTAVAGPPHAVAKLYFIAWPESKWAVFQRAFRAMGSTVDGVRRQAAPWPDWMITTRIDTTDFWHIAWEAISCHDSQVSNYESLSALPLDQHRVLWGTQWFYRVFSLVNGGRQLETDLFDGIRGAPAEIRPK
jgi:LmbE family N-acetylglucosaminyl deacetylase